MSRLLLLTALISAGCGTSSTPPPGADGGELPALEEPAPTADGGAPLTCAETHCTAGYVCCQLCKKVSCSPKQISCPRVECQGP